MTKASASPLADVAVSVGTWLAALDDLPLECDGLSRSISALLDREGVAHRLLVGSLTVPAVGATPYHWWVELGTGHVVDLRARMWLGASERVPHGVSLPAAHHLYDAHDVVRAAVSPFVFRVLTGFD